jgi:hypothetical protein
MFEAYLCRICDGVVVYSQRLSSVLVHDTVFEKLTSFLLQRGTL